MCSTYPGSTGRRGVGLVACPHPLDKTCHSFTSLYMNGKRAYYIYLKCFQQLNIIFIFCTRLEVYLTCTDFACSHTENVYVCIYFKSTFSHLADALIQSMYYGTYPKYCKYILSIHCFCLGKVVSLNRRQSI